MFKIFTNGGWQYYLKQKQKVILLYTSNQLSLAFSNNTQFLALAAAMVTNSPYNFAEIITLTLLTWTLNCRISVDRLSQY